MDVFWYIPTHGDGRYLATDKGSRRATPFYLRQIAEAVDGLGFGGALLPTGRSCEDAWVVASSLAAVTRRMKFLVAVRRDWYRRQCRRGWLRRWTKFPAGAVSSM